MLRLSTPGQNQDAQAGGRSRLLVFGGYMRKLIAALLASSVLVFGGVACDDNKAQDKIDEDDTNFGPGDGKDEIGPAR